MNGAIGLEIDTINREYLCIIIIIEIISSVVGVFSFLYCLFYLC